MKVELIPVIEIGYNNQDSQVPDKYPYWKYPEIWDKYNYESYEKAGFKDKLNPYLPGSSFYRLRDITESNLLKLTKDHTEQMRLGNYDREQASPFFGGYVLRVDGRDKYFPQCCGDLSDIQYWEKLVTDKKETFYQGHPEPKVKIKDEIITFDFTVGEFDEHFAPPPPDNHVKVDIPSLKQAIELVKIELKVFANRLKKINVDEQLNIENIDKLLVWGDD